MNDGRGAGWQQRADARNVILQFLPIIPTKARLMPIWGCCTASAQCRSTSNRTRLSRWSGRHLGHSRRARVWTSAHNWTGVAVSSAGALEGRWCRKPPWHPAFIRQQWASDHTPKSCGQALGEAWPRAIRSGTGRGGDVTGSR